MYRRYKVMRIVCDGHKWARATMLILTCITTISMLWVLPMTFVGRTRHAAWKASGLDNAAFFTRDFRFDWIGFDDVPPAYDRLVEYLNELNGCTAVRVDYCDVYLPGAEEPIVLCIYPEILRETIQTPLSEGTFESASDSGTLQLVLDRRLRNEYAIGDTVPVTCTWEADDWHAIEATAVVTGFLSSDNDHISTLGGSNTKALRYFAAKAVGDDPYIALVADGPIFQGKAYTGGCSSLLLLPAKSQPVDQFLDAWLLRNGTWGR